MPFNLQAWDIIVIALLILVLFGAAKIPEFARSIGKAVKEFKKEMKSEDSSDEEPAKKDREEKK
jgi:sec-independent protein translocase protein TatA